MGTGRAGPPSPPLPQPPTSRLALARAHFLEEEAAGSPRAVHDTVVVVGDPIVSAHGRLPRRTTLWPKEHLRAPCAWVHAAEAAWVAEGALAGVWGAGGQRSGNRDPAHTEVTSTRARAALTARAVELLENVLLAGAGAAQELALAGIVDAVTAAHGALGSPPAGCGTQARSCLSIRRARAGAAEAAGHVGAGVPGPCAQARVESRLRRLRLRPLLRLRPARPPHSPHGPRLSRRMRRCWLHCARCSSHSLL